jgi:hypothetical protein
VARSAVPLSSDCFSRFGQADPAWQHHNADARWLSALDGGGVVVLLFMQFAHPHVRATHSMLMSKLIPAFLDRMRARPIPSNLKLFVSVLHAFGINVRCLAILHRLCNGVDAKDTDIRRFVMCEMVARAVMLLLQCGLADCCGQCKNYVRGQVCHLLSVRPEAAHRMVLLELFGPACSEGNWAKVLWEAHLAFPGFTASLADVFALRAAVQPRALELLCVSGDLASPQITICAKVNYLFTFKFNVARTFFEDLRHLVDLESISVIQHNLLRFYEGEQLLLGRHASC